MKWANPLTHHVPGAPFQPGQRVQVIAHVTSFLGRAGEVIHLEYECGCGQTYPGDPMIGVRFPDGAEQEFWQGELLRLAEQEMTADEARAAELLHRAYYEPYPPEVTRRRILLTPVEDRCAPACKMWFLDGETGEPTRCDDCCVDQDDPLTDLDIGRLPEAVAAHGRFIDANKTRLLSA